MISIFFLLLEIVYIVIRNSIKYLEIVEDTVFIPSLVDPLPLVLPQCHHSVRVSAAPERAAVQRARPMVIYCSRWQKRISALDDTSIDMPIYAEGAHNYHSINWFESFTALSLSMCV